MMHFHFFKYQGTGNDFVVLDNRSLTFPKNNTKLIASLCDRRFGIGADGLMLLENDNSTDFKMVYYNADGNESSMCGNGGRCLVAFAKHLGIIGQETTFIAVDGLHHATINAEDVVSLQMKDVTEIAIASDYVFLNTGSPHHVQLVDNLESFPVVTEGAKLRYSDLYGQAGSNINFVKTISDAEFSIRTYERGVEDETLSCGTGATAVAIAMHATGKTKAEIIAINVEGGKLQVQFSEENGIYTNVHLIGPAKLVFAGEIEMSVA